MVGDVDTFILRIHRTPSPDRQLRGTIQRPGDGAQTFTNASQLLRFIEEATPADAPEDGNGAGSTSSSDIRDT